MKIHLALRACVLTSINAITTASEEGSRESIWPQFSPKSAAAGRIQIGHAIMDLCMAARVAGRYLPCLVMNSKSDSGIPSSFTIPSEAFLKSAFRTAARSPAWNLPVSTRAR